MKISVRAFLQGFTLLEVMMSTAISTLILGGLFTAAIAMQKCFVATEDYGTGKCDQMRLTDYLSLDLRRALSVTAGTDETFILKVQIPDYYRYAGGQIRPPAISGLTVNYGDPAQPVSVIYTKVGSSIYRRENTGPSTQIATNVDDFQIIVKDPQLTTGQGNTSGTALSKVVKTEITFSPRFRQTATADTRTATTIYNTTLLRNKRRAAS